jgi:hypothetical protein
MGSICPAAQVMPRRGSQFVVVRCLRQVVEDVHDRFPSRGRHRGQTAFRTDDERRIARWTPPARPILTGDSQEKGLVTEASSHAEAIAEAVFREE